MDHKHKVLIIGGGASGIYAAYLMVTRGLTRDIVILEAENRIGGRIHTILFNGKCLELGAQWIHGRGDNLLWKFVDEHKIAISERANRDGEGVFIRNDGQVVPKDILDETRSFLWQVHKDANKFAQVQNVADAPKSMGHYFHDRFQDWLATAKQGEDDVTLRWRQQVYNWFIKFEEADSGCDNFFQHSTISWGEYVDYDCDTSFADSTGYKSVLDLMASELDKHGVQILLEHQVKNVDYSKDEISVTGLDLNSGRPFRFLADHVMSTVSLGILKAHHQTLFTPRLPHTLVEAIEEISFGTIDRIKIDFEDVFWDPEDPGIMVLWDQEDWEAEVDRSNWIRFIYGYDEILFHPTTLMGWISGKAARFMETLTDAEIAADICDFLQSVIAKYKGEEESYKLPKLRQIVVTRWFTNENFKGVYCYRNQECDLKGITNKDLAQPVYRNGCPRILFGGEATDHDHYGTVHGAMTASVREVDRLEAFWRNNQFS